MEGFEHVRGISVGGLALLFDQLWLELPCIWMEGGLEEALRQRWLHPCQNLQVCFQN